MKLKRPDQHKPIERQSWFRRAFARGVVGAMVVGTLSPLLPVSWGNFLKGPELNYSMAPAQVLNPYSALIEQSSQDIASFVNLYITTGNLQHKQDAIARYNDYISAFSPGPMDSAVETKIKEHEKLKPIYEKFQARTSATPATPFNLADFLNAIGLAKTNRQQAVASYGEDFVEQVNIGSTRRQVDEAFVLLGDFILAAGQSDSVQKRQEFLQFWEQNKTRVGFVDMFEAQFISTNFSAGYLGDTKDGRAICLAIDHVYQIIVQRGSLSQLQTQYGAEFVRKLQTQYTRGSIPTLRMQDEGERITRKYEVIQSKLDDIDAFLRKEGINPNVQVTLGKVITSVQRLETSESELRGRFSNFQDFLQSQGMQDPVAVLVHLTSFLEVLTDLDRVSTAKVQAFLTVIEPDVKKRVDSGLELLKSISSSDVVTKAKIKEYTELLNMQKRTLELSAQLSQQPAIASLVDLSTIAIQGLEGIIAPDERTRAQLAATLLTLKSQRDLRVLEADMLRMQEKWVIELETEDTPLPHLLRLKGAYVELGTKLDEWTKKLEEIRKEYTGTSEKLTLSTNLYALKGLVPYAKLKAHIHEWRGQFDALRRDGATTYAQASKLNSTIPIEPNTSAEALELTIATARRDIQTLEMWYEGRMSYSRTIDERWLSRVEALLTKLDLRTGDSSGNGLEWLYTAYLETGPFNREQIRTDISKIREVLGFARMTLSGLSSLGNIAAIQQQRQAFDQQLETLETSGSVNSDFAAQMRQASAKSLSIFESYDPTAQTLQIYADQLGLVQSAIESLPSEFRERVAVQFYSDWHKEMSGFNDYRAIAASHLRMVSDSEFVALRAGLGSVLAIKTMVYRQTAPVPGRQQVSLGETTIEGQEALDIFNSLSLSAQYSLHQLMTQTCGYRWWEGTLDDVSWTKFATMVKAIQSVPGAYSPYLVQTLGPKLMEHDPGVIEVVFGAVATYSALFYNMGDYQGLQEYYRILPGKLNKMFGDIFTAKDQIKEEYADVRIRMPLEEFAPQLYIPGANILINVPKHIYRSITGFGLTSVVSVADVTQTVGPIPNLVEMEQVMFDTDMVMARVNVPLPFITAPLALSKINLLAPDKIPEVGEWYATDVTEALTHTSTVIPDLTVSQQSNQFNLTEQGEGKSGEQYYRLTRQTREKDGEATQETKSDEGGVKLTNIPIFQDGESTGLFGGGRNAMSVDARFRRTGDTLNELTTSLYAAAPGGADTAIYFQRINDGASGGEPKYYAHVFKRIDNGSFTYDESRTLTASEARTMYQTLKPELEVTDRVYGRVHPVVGKHDVELEGATIFIGDERFSGAEKQGYGLAYQYTPQAGYGGYVLQEFTRGGRLSAGGGSFSDKQFVVGRLYLSNIDGAKGIQTSDQRVEDTTGYHARGTFVEAGSTKIDAFVTKYGGDALIDSPFGIIAAHLAGQRYYGVDFLRMPSQAGGRTYFVDKDMISFAAASVLAQKQEEEWKVMQAAGGASHLFRILGYEVRGTTGAIYSRENWSGGFLELTYNPKTAFLSFRKLGGIGVVLTKDETETEKGVSGGVFSLKGRGSDYVDLELAYPLAAEARKYAGDIDLVGGLAFPITQSELGVVGTGVWGAVRMRFLEDNRLTLISMLSLSKERKKLAGAERKLSSLESGVIARYSLASDDWQGARRLQLTGGVSTISQTGPADTFGTQIDIQGGLLSGSYKDRLYGTLGYQRWSNLDQTMNTLTVNLGYSRIMPIQDLFLIGTVDSLSLTSSFRVGTRELKKQKQEEFVLQWTFNLGGTF